MYKEEEKLFKKMRAISLTVFVSADSQGMALWAWALCVTESLYH
jgi:hypothetical protein